MTCDYPEGPIKLFLPAGVFLKRVSGSFNKVWGGDKAGLELIFVYTQMTPPRRQNYTLRGEAFKPKH